MSDYKWQMMCLQSRIEHPELYEKTENVQEVIKELSLWLENNIPKEAVAI